MRLRHDYLKMGVITAGMALLLECFLPSPDPAPESRELKRRTNAYVKTGTHQFFVEDYFSPGKEFPKIAAFYEDPQSMGSKRPSRVYLSSREDGIFDLQFNDPGSTCYRCHSPMFEDKEIDYRGSSKEETPRKRINMVF